MKINIVSSVGADVEHKLIPKAGLVAMSRYPPRLPLFALAKHVSFNACCVLVCPVVEPLTLFYHRIPTLLFPFTSRASWPLAPLEGLWHVKVTDHRAKADYAHFLADMVDIHFANVDKILPVQDSSTPTARHRSTQRLNPQKTDAQLKGSIGTARQKTDRS